MKQAAVNLIVLRTADLVRAAEIYSQLGMEFKRERHGSGPEYLASQMGSVVFELYPVEDMRNTASIRIGFRVSSVADTVKKMTDAGARLITPVAESPWGLRAVVADLDGHRIELTEAVKATPKNEGRS